VNRKVETACGQPWSQLQQCEIRLKGYLSSYRAQMFEGLEMVQGPEGETALSGPVIDQAVLHRILNRLRDLGVRLLSAKSAEQDTTEKERNRVK
jgi:hypothetical protein